MSEKRVAHLVPARPATRLRAEPPSLAYTIRAARPSDLPAVVALDKEVTGIAKEEYWRVLFERGERRRAGEPHILVAASGAAGVLGGFIVGEVRSWEFGSAPCGWVYAISVRPGARLQGLGQQLFDAICAEFRSAGAEHTRTMVARDNRMLLLFFRAAGMTAGPYIELEKRLEP